jgi:hypothetical protein
MRRLFEVLALVVVGVPILLLAPHTAAAAPCAFLDANDDGVFNAGDTLLSDSQWIGNTLTTTVPFVVPVGCPTTGVLNNVPSPFPGVQVIAPKITFLGQLHILKPGGRGIVFWADPAVSGGIGDGSITIGNGSVEAQLEAGGSSLLFDAGTIPAVFRRSISLLASGKCTINLASIRGFVPTGSTDIGIDCNDDILIRASSIVGSRVNIQSITGTIDAKSLAAVGPGNLGNICDSKSAAPNGILDAADFPCTITSADIAGLGLPKTFADVNALSAFCGATAFGGVNTFAAFNDPLILIAQKNLDLSGGAAGATTLSGRYRVTLASVEGDVLTQFAQVNHGSPPVPGGARIFVFAHPTSVNRLANDREDFVGPSSGTINIASACYQSPNKIVLGTGATVTGTSAPPPCTQFPAGFVFQVSAFF